MRKAPRLKLAATLISKTRSPSSRRRFGHRKEVNISTALAGQWLGIKEVDDGVWLVSFMRDDFGYFDLEQKIPRSLDGRTEPAWRRGRDSNPRYSLRPYGALAKRCLQPLGHLSSIVDMPDTGASRKRQIGGHAKFQLKIQFKTSFAARPSRVGPCTLRKSF